MEEKINIVYFSGTGGTERAAKCFEAAFTKAGVSVSLFRLKDVSENYDFGKASFLLLYPVYALNAPKKVHEWIKSLDRVN
ncbi:MAG: hypothetical protein QMB62_07635, partial [Oscillospiraceae bacterium]